jgi:hypothetical protein
MTDDAVALAALFMWRERVPREKGPFRSSAQFEPWELDAAVEPHVANEGYEVTRA